jgi:hypothetical protein
VRAQLARFRHACPEGQREKFWHVPDDELDAIANDDTRSPLAVFDATEPAADISSWVAERRYAIDARRKATRTELRLSRLAAEFKLSPLDVDALLLALLPSLHSEYRRWYGLLQHDPCPIDSKHRPVDRNARGQQRPLRHARPRTRDGRRARPIAAGQLHGHRRRPCGGATGVR